MRLSINFLILVLILSCNQITEKQNETASEKTQEVQERQQPQEIEDVKEVEENKANAKNENENFETLDVKVFNKFLASERAYSKIEVMLLFYPGEIEPPKDSEETDFQEEVLDNGNTLITLIHDNLENDSLKGYKYVMELKRNNDKWMVVSAKRNWKYYEGKGHTDWGISKKPNETFSEEVREIEKNTVNTTNEDENFKFLTIGFFNRHLGTLTDELSSQEVMRLFIPKEEPETNEGNEIETIQEETLENGNTLVTLIQDNLMDDSLKGEKYVMELERIDDKWNVVYVKKNWKCREGRGHTDWGIELCL